jgi:glucose-6-phosphate isomerase
MWSPISLPAILELEENFKEFLVGGHEADNLLLKDDDYNDFINLLSFSDIWYNNFDNKHTRVLLYIAGK